MNVVCSTLNFYQFTQNLEDILAEWQLAWNLARRRVTRFQRLDNHDQQVKYENTDKNETPKESPKQQNCKMLQARFG